MEELVSIVVPVYQAQKYIGTCVEDVLKQDYPNIEIILVNDGSKDRSGEICDEYAEKYTNLRVIHQENQGPGMARDTGVKEARGKYIVFVDSDDFLDGTDAISKLVECAEKEQADIVVGSFRTFSEGTISDVNYHHLDELQDTDSVEFRFRGYFQYGHLGFNWGKVYLREFLINNQINGLSYSFVEDKAVNMRCSACKPRYAFVKDSVYQYRIREGESPFKNKGNLIPVWLRAAEEFNTYLAEKNCKEEYGDLVGIHVFLGIYTLTDKIIRDEDNRISTLRKSLKEYCSSCFAKEQFHLLRKGVYIKEMESFVWKAAIRITATACCLRLFGLMALGMKMVKGLKIDQMVISKKYGE